MFEIKQPSQERALLIALKTPKISDVDLNLSLEELKLLAKTAKAKVVHAVIQKRKAPDPSTFIGKGKAEELANLASELNIDVVIFDNNLTPAQTKNLEKIFGIKIIDRTQLILDIFAQRARTKEGKLQVELAQLQYLLPRLVGKGIELSRLGGGIGTRGPGEKLLEVQRRKINDRIAFLKRELEKVKAKRKEERKRRKIIPVPVAAIVGYTNAGKSTLLNALTNADVLAEDKLFATLDPTTKRVILPDKRILLFSDTVGFINNLPHTLIAAFRATLEEVKESDILIHVIDASHPYVEKQIEAVHQVLEELEITDKPIFNVFNKIDLVTKEHLNLLLEKYQPSIGISALYKKNLDMMLEKISTLLKKDFITTNIKLPYYEYNKIKYIFQWGEILSQEYLDNYIYMKISIPKRFFYLIEKFQEREINENNKS